MKINVIGIMLRKTHPAPSQLTASDVRLRKQA